MKDQRGVVYLEMLIGFLPVFLFFLGTLQIADASVAHLVVEHAATTAARAAVVVLPDDGAYYEDDDNAAVHEFKDFRQSDVERAADTILQANGRLNLSLLNVALDKPKYEERELVTAQVTAPYRCLVAVFCPGGLTMSASAKLVYQGAKYKYEPATGWASSAANRGLENLRGDKAKPGEKKEGEADPSGKPDDPNKPDDEADKPDDGNDKPDDGDNKPDDEADKPDDGNDKPDDGDNKPDDPVADNDDPNRPPEDGADRPADPEAQKRADDLRRALPRNLRNTPIVADPTLDGSTVRVHYTHDDRGRITGVEIRVGPDAGPRHIQDHAPTVRAMKRYQGVAGKARALADRFKSWLTGNPNAGPGTLAWESAREVEKLAGIIENRGKQLENPNLTDAERKELERELDAYEKQLAEHQKTLEQVTNEPGRGYVAANSEGQVGKDVAKAKYPGIPELPPGYGWRLDDNGEPYVVRTTVDDGTGTDRPSKYFDKAAYDRGARDPKELFPDRKIKPAKLPPANQAKPHTPSPDARKRMDAIVAQRQNAITNRTLAEAQVENLAREAGLDPKKIQGDEGKKLIEQARKNGGDKAVLDKLELARQDLTDARRDLTEASEQLGNEMAVDYMRQTHPNATRLFPPEDPDDPNAPLPKGTSNELDMVYMDGDTIIVIEAKGAGSKLGVSERAGAQQGSPEYLDHIARRMLPKAKEPLKTALEDILRRGMTGAPNVRYLLVEAPTGDTTSANNRDGLLDTAGGDTNAGRVREFGL